MWKNVGSLYVDAATQLLLIKIAITVSLPPLTFGGLQWSPVSTSGIILGKLQFAGFSDQTLAVATVPLPFCLPKSSPL